MSIHPSSLCSHSNTRAWWRSTCHKGKVLHKRWIPGTCIRIVQRQSLITDTLFSVDCTCQTTKYTKMPYKCSTYSMFQSQLLTTTVPVCFFNWVICLLLRRLRSGNVMYSPFPYSIYRGSAQQAGMEDTTVTPTLPALSTRKTSAVSSMTVETSSSGCTCDSTSCCDGRAKVFGQKHKNRSDCDKLWPMNSSLPMEVSELLWRNRGQNTHGHTHADTCRHTLTVNTPWTQTFLWCSPHLSAVDWFQWRGFRLWYPPSAILYLLLSNMYHRCYLHFSKNPERPVWTVIPRVCAVVELLQCPR